MYRDILVATDGKAGGRRASDHALGLARALGADLHALVVLEAGVTTRDQLRADVKGEAESALAAIKQTGNDEGVAVTTELRKGDPCDTIVGYAEERDVDLIVVGTTTGGRLDRILYGSVTQCVARTASVPVLAVGEKAGPVFETPEDAAFRFRCTPCDSILSVSPETRDALLAQGCIICGADVTEDAFSTLEGQA